MKESIMEKKTFQSTFRALIAPAAIGVGLALSVQPHAQAQSAAGAGPSHSPTAAAANPATPATAAKAEAEVRRVDAANGRIQLRHGFIANLDMPPMTMVFRVKSPELLEGLKEGDKIFFTAEKMDGGYVVTSVERRP